MPPRADEFEVPRKFALATTVTVHVSGSGGYRGGAPRDAFVSTGDARAETATIAAVTPSVIGLKKRLMLRVREV